MNCIEGVNMLSLYSDMETLYTWEELKDEASGRPSPRPRPRFGRGLMISPRPRPRSKNHSSVCLGLGQKSQCPSSASAYFQDITEDLTEDILKIYTVEY